MVIDQILLVTKDYWELEKNYQRQSGKLNIGVLVMPRTDFEKVAEKTMVVGGAAISLLPGTIVSTVVSAAANIKRAGDVVATTNRSGQIEEETGMSERSPFKIMGEKLYRDVVVQPWNALTDHTYTELIIVVFKIDTLPTRTLPDGRQQPMLDCVVPIRRPTDAEWAQRKAEVTARTAKEAVVSGAEAVQRLASPKKDDERPSSSSPEKDRPPSSTPSARDASSSRGQSIVVTSPAAARAPARRTSSPDVDCSFADRDPATRQWLQKLVAKTNTELAELHRRGEISERVRLKIEAAHAAGCR